MDRCIRKRRIRSGWCGCAAQQVDAAAAVTAAIPNPTIYRTPAAGNSSPCRSWREHDHRSARESRA